MGEKRETRTDDDFTKGHMAREHYLRVVTPEFLNNLYRLQLPFSLGKLLQYWQKPKSLIGNTV